MRQPLTALILLCVVFCAGAAPSEFLTTGDGSYYNPYRLSKAAHLAELDKEVRGGSSFAGKFLVLTADIDMTSLPEWMGGFSGIGEAGSDKASSSSFCGDFNGRHFTVRNLSIQVTADYGTGLFNSLGEGACVHHLLLDASCTVSGGSNTGAVAGCVWDGIVEFCSSAATVSGNRNVGGIAGTIHAGAIQHTANTGRVNAVKGVGGIVGLMDGRTSVVGCYNTGEITASTFGACAGIAGQGYGKADVVACYNIGRINGRPSAEFDIDISNILSDRPPVVWNGEMKGCCAVSRLSGFAEDGVTDFTQEEMRSAVAETLLNEALKGSPYVVNPNSTAVETDRLFTRRAGFNGGFPVPGWELALPDSGVAITADTAAAVEVCGDTVRSLSGRPLSATDMAGRIVATGMEVRLSPGFYMVNGQKIMIRK